MANGHNDCAEGWRVTFAFDDRRYNWVEPPFDQAGLRASGGTVESMLGQDGYVDCHAAALA